MCLKMVQYQSDYRTVSFQIVKTYLRTKADYIVSISVSDLHEAVLGGFDVCCLAFRNLLTALLEDP